MLPPRRKAPNISTKPQPLRLTFEERLIIERITSCPSKKYGFNVIEYWSS